jgi:hypothetical protein
MTLPKKFIIPKDRIPKPKSQGVYDACAAVTITKILEIFEYKKTGVYTPLSVGYMYGMNNDPNKKKGGMNYNYVLPILLDRGTVPEDMCPIMDEYPAVRKKIEALPNIEELNKEAEKTRIKGYVRMPLNSKFTQTTKEYLYKYQMPMMGDIVGHSHCVVVVGWDGDEFLYQDHKGRDTLFKSKLNDAYYLDGGLEDVKDMNFTDVKETDWFYESVKDVFNKGIMVGTSETEFSPNKFVTRAEMATVISRIMTVLEDRG